MVRWQIVSFACLVGLILVAVISLNACGANSASTLSQSGNRPDQPAAMGLPDPAGGDGEEPALIDPVPRNTLTLAMPILAGLTAGEEFEVEVGGRFASEVYQGSLRVAFDQQVVVPIAATRGDLLPGNVVHLAGLEQPGYVAFAFTALPGEAGMQAGQGVLLALRFKVISPVSTAQPINLVNSADYLQLRDRQGQRLAFDTEITAGVQ